MFPTIFLLTSKKLYIMEYIMLERNLEFFKRLAKGIVSVFGERCEVVLHDFKDVTQSLVYMEGNLTNRAIGAPITDLTYRLINEFGDQVPSGYKKNIEDVLLNFRYWRDEPGKNSMCYWSENHQVLFATAELLAGQLWPVGIDRRELLIAGDHISR